MPESRARGYEAGRFSFNVKGGRCEACQGDGVIKVEMHFLADVYVPCDVCRGKRYNRETLEIRFKGKNIHEVLDMTVEDALPFFSAVPTVQPKLQTLLDVGLVLRAPGPERDHAVGRRGAARQAREGALASAPPDARSTSSTSPPPGLHFADIAQLLAVLHRLRDEGNTIIVIEHNLDVIKTADWVVDLGPRGRRRRRKNRRGGDPRGHRSPPVLVHGALPQGGFAAGSAAGRATGSATEARVRLRAR